MPESYDPRDPSRGRESGQDPARFDPEYARPTQPPSFPLGPAAGAGPAVPSPDDYTLYDHQISPYAADPYGRAAPAPLWTPPAAPRRARAPRRGRSRAPLWVAVGVVATVLVAACGFAALAQVGKLGALGGPDATASGFCGDVRAQRYDQAYARLGGALRSGYSAAQFAAAMAALDHAEGRATACSSSGGDPSPGANTATETVTLTRATAGTLQGVVRLTHGSAGWQIGGIDTSLLGVNLGAALAVTGFCAALKGQQYADAYALLGASAQAAAKPDDFAQMAAWHDAADGPVGACDLAGIGKGASDAAADVTLSVTRDKLGQKQGAASLKVEGGAWKLSAIDAALQGSDLGALVTGSRYCAALKSGNSGALQDLVTPGYWLNLSGVFFANLFSGTKWTGCTLDATTFKLSGTTASYGVSLAVTKGGKTSQQPVTFQVVRSGDAWKLDNIIFPK